MVQVLGHCAYYIVALMVYVAFRLCLSVRDQLETLSYRVEGIRFAYIPRECVYIALDVIGTLYDWANQVTFVTFKILLHSPHTNLYVWIPQRLNFYYGELGFAIRILRFLGVTVEF